MAQNRAPLRIALAAAASIFFTPSINLAQDTQQDIEASIPDAVSSFLTGYCGDITTSQGKGECSTALANAAIGAANRWLNDTATLLTPIEKKASDEIIIASCSGIKIAHSLSLPSRLQTVSSRVGTCVNSILSLANSFPDVLSKTEITTEELITIKNVSSCASNGSNSSCSVEGVEPKRGSLSFIIQKD